MFFQTPAWDMALLEWINQGARCAFLDYLMPVASSYLLWWAHGAGLAVVLAVRRGVRPVLFLVAALLLAVALSDASTNLLKHATLRVRPLNAVAGTWFKEDGVWQRRAQDFVQTKERGSSYPSAHAANAMAAIVILAWLLPRSRRLAWTIPLVIGYSRVYLGKHYPTDVLVGWLVGLAAALLLWLAWRNMVRRWWPGAGSAVS